MKQSEEVTTFIGKLFQTLVLSKSKALPSSSPQSQCEEPVKSSFYQNFTDLLSICKSGIKDLCSDAHKFEVRFSTQFKESTARKIVNTLMFLSKDIKMLLDDGILNLYMDLVEMKEKLIYEENLEQEKNFIQNCIKLTEPLLFEFFVFREYKKVQRDQGLRLKKSLSLTKKFSAETQQDLEPTYKRRIKRKQTICEEQIQEIRKQIHSSKMNELLKQFLSEYETQLHNLEQVCKICSKNIKLHHLEEHVVYCQKKYIIKQDLKSLQKNIVGFANQLIAKRKNIQNSGVCHINSGPLTNVQDMNMFGDEEYAELLYEIINVHRIGSLKNNSKKIHSQSKIREQTEKYQELICRFQNFIEKKQDNEELVDNVNCFLTLEKQILNLTLQLRTVELEYESLREIVSSSTIRPPSSTHRMSQKKSRFACNNFLEVPQHRSSKNRSCSSKVCFENIQEPDSNSNDDDKDKNERKRNNFQSYENFDQDNLPIVTLKTKQSLGNSKIVHFHVDQSEDQHKSPQKVEDSRIKKSRRVKSMVMFDDSDDSDFDCHIKKKKQEQNQNSQKSSRPEENVGIKDFQILKFLGKGAFGKVYAVRKKNTTDLYALKMIDIDENWGPQQFQQIRNEHEIFKKVAGEHLVQAPYCFSEGSVHVFMMEFMPGGDLSKVLEEQVYLQEEHAKYVIAEIVLAIQHLHRADIIHRDLKPQNLVIDQRGHLKLTDFGLSEIKLQNKIEKVMSIKKEKQELAKRRRTRRTGMVAAKQKAKIIGTPDYIAPQIINSISINNRSIDWWSLGVISYEILIGVRPFCGNTIEEVLDNILKFNIEWPEIGEEEGMISEKAYDFIQKLLSKDFVNRLGAQDISEIKNHPFFDGVNWQKLKYEPAHITPNYAKIKELLEMQENSLLRNQIEQKTQKTLNNMKIPELDNFIRFDILGQKTVKQANKVISQKTGTLKRLQSIKNIMTDKENDSGERRAIKERKDLTVRSMKGFDQKQYEVHVLTVENDI